MPAIITDLEKLNVAAEPLIFIDKDGQHLEEGKEIIRQLHELLEGDANLMAISAPQIGIEKRIFCIKFNDEIKTFINPIITKKSDYKIVTETCSSMPGKEILITRPEMITVVYHNGEFKYEDNKLLGPAARLFDQQIQFLDGVTPAELGLISDIEQDGSLMDLTEEELTQVITIYKQFIAAKVKSLEATISEDAELKDQYKQLKFTEGVINDRIQVIREDPEIKQNRAQRRAANKNKKKVSRN